MEKQLIPTVSRVSFLRLLRDSSLQTRCVCAGVSVHMIVIVAVAVGFGLMSRDYGDLYGKLQNVSSITSTLSEELNYMTRHSCAKTSLSTQHQVAFIHLKSGSIIPVVCDTETDGGNWIIIQRREKGDVSFTNFHWRYRVREAYVNNGIGNAFSDRWLGLSKILDLCGGPGKCELRIDMEFHGNTTSVPTRSDGKYFAQYHDFYLSGYYIHVSGYNNGTAGDALSGINGGRFHYFPMLSSYSRHRAGCGAAEGAWWYKYGASCYTSNLNGKWKGTNGTGVIWGPITGRDKSLSFTEMKIRQKK